MRILGIDPGLTRCGIGIIDTDNGRRVEFVNVDVARSDPQLPPAQRLLLIDNKIEEVMRIFHPEIVAIERVFAQENVRTVMSTAQVSGIVMLAAARRSLPVFLHSPSEVKAAVTGNGAADKKQVQIMVQKILHLEKLPRPKDAADALAIAICAAWRGDTTTARVLDSAQHGGAGQLPRTEGADLTEAQKLWAKAERAHKMTGAVANSKSVSRY